MSLHPYFGQNITLATQHQKGVLIAPHFLDLIGAHVQEINIDTDQLGTFSGEIERVGTPREVALKKARLGAMASRNTRAIASEGSIGADFYLPFINSDFEIIAFIDDELEIEVIESHRSTEIIAQTLRIKKEDDLSEFLARADFPNHKLIVRSIDKPTKFCKKGIANQSDLNEIIEKGLQKYGELIIENDLRAHCSPSRQKNISAVGLKLAKRLQALCPECQSPGWGVVDFTTGVPCKACGAIAEEAARSEILGCPKCSYQMPGKVLAEMIDPSRCNFCNP